MNTFKCIAGSTWVTRSYSICYLQVYRAQTLQAMYRLLNPSNAEATFVQSTRTQRFLKTFWMLSWWYSLDSTCWIYTLRWVPMCQDFSHFLGFFHHCIVATVATSSIWVNPFMSLLDMFNVSSYDTFENSFEIYQDFMKYLKEISVVVESSQHFSFNYFPQTMYW